MARRKDKDAQGAPAQAVVAETVVEETPGETHIIRTVREWQPHAPERLAEIESIIDSWGRRSTDSVPRMRRLDPEELQARVDRVTKRVKGSRKVVVKETVTDWVERPAEDGPEPEAEPEPEPLAEAEAVLEEVAVHEGAKPSRPKRRFKILGFVGKRSEKAAKPKKAKEGREAPDGDDGYQPQCAALTEDGEQCRNSARGVSRYCSSHKGYQPPTAKGLAQRIEGGAWDPKDDVADHESVAAADTRPVVRKAPDTRIKVRKAAKRPAKAARKPAKKSGRKKR